MQFTKAIIPMAGDGHRDLPFHRMETGQGTTKHTVCLHIEDLLAAGIRQVALITRPGTDLLLHELASHFGSAVVFIEQPKPLGFGDAVLRAERWARGEPCIVHVCDHIFIPYSLKSCVLQLIEVATRERCTISAVQATHESQLPYFGVVGGRRRGGREPLYEVDTMIEKPTPTVAEESCTVPRLRQGTYLGFFGIHAVSPMLFDVLHECQGRAEESGVLGLTEALAILCRREKYLAFEVLGHRVDLEGPFGLLRAQIALALHGPRREEVLRVVLEELATERSARVR